MYLYIKTPRYRIVQRLTGHSMYKYDTEKGQKHTSMSRDTSLSVEPVYFIITLKADFTSRLRRAGEVRGLQRRTFAGCWPWTHQSHQPWLLQERKWVQGLLGNQQLGQGPGQQLGLEQHR
mmetsp:Transcript_25751/g.31219  ORF Transcript_25751/g.31219 Transcript_25751/m.31219 type:complete len:120 (+) Transcript_25751:143-502(+)